MRYLSFVRGHERGVAVKRNGVWFETGASDLLALIEKHGQALADPELFAAAARELDISTVKLLPPLARPPKIICVGLNYVDHAKESPYKDIPTYPTFFGRFTTSLVPHGAPMIRPQLSVEFDFEGELVAVIGKGGRHISKAAALDHIVGYSIFNEGSIRDYQFKSPQWTPGKNFDGTGAFGPELVTADELPPGGIGLSIETRLNGKVMQSGNTRDLIFPVVDLVAIASESDDARTGRRDCHRHAGWCRLCAQTAGFHACRRCLRSRDRRSRHPEQSDQRRRS